MADALDLLRHDALTKRLNNIGGNRIHWSAKDGALISDYIMSMPAQMFRTAAPASRKLVDAGAAAVVRRKLSDHGIVIRDAHPTDRKFLFIISSEDVDLAGDVVTVDGIDCANFLKNPVVLNSHDSTALPIASSTAPIVSGKTLTAVAKFPRPGVSECSDQVAAAIRASLIRACSIGFVPLRWSFAKGDTSRPFGVNFHEIRLLEWSCCSVPCNPACLLLGTVDGQSAASHSSSRNFLLGNDAKMAARRREARALADQASSISASMSDDPALTRDQRLRLAEAQKFSRIARGGK
jgi:hypothetical protein